LSGSGLEPLVAESGYQLSLGFAAVIAFFGLSGWLLTGSRERNGLLPFLRNRALRVFPAYWIALVFGALVAIAFGAQVPTAAGYVASNVTILLASETGVPPAFGGGWINGSLWTLRWEVACYVVLAVVPGRWIKGVSAGLLVAFVGIWVVRPGFEFLLILAFVTGVMVRSWRVPTTVPYASLAFGGALLLLAAQQTQLACVLGACAALGLMHVPLRFTADLSYGTYVFAYPIQRTIVGVGIAEPLVVAALTAAIVLPLAWLSWELVERRAIGLNRMSVETLRRRLHRPAELTEPQEVAASR
jgi:peptidoglycan/LPS O-acetylase OafA/YrhL